MKGVFFVMSQESAQPHSHDVGLPKKVIRRRRRARYVAHWMLLFAVLSAVAGWSIYGQTFFSALRRPDLTPSFSVIGAYALLMVSSVTLILGLWYLLVAQVNRIARIVEEPGESNVVALKCRNCGWPHDAPDRFCRHCGKALGAEGPPAPATLPPRNGSSNPFR